MIVLDTDHISLLERVDSPEGQRLRKRFEVPDVPAPHVTIISYEEQVRGWLARVAKARTVKDQVDAYRRLLGQQDNYCAWAVLAFDESAAVEYQRLQKLRLRLGAMDLKIAAIALAKGATLLTRNARDFGKIPDLRTEDWTR